MKKIISIILILVFVLSAMASLTLFPSAAIQGDWVTSRRASDYEDPGSYDPASGYYYDPAIGFVTVPPELAENRTPYVQAHTKDAINLKTDNDGYGNSVSLKLTVLEFPYDGGEGRDEWIAFTINSQPIAHPGSLEYGEGACILLRGSGDGIAHVQPFYVDKEGGKSFSLMTDVGMPTIEVPLNELGQEEYTFEIRYDGDGYSFAINGNWYQDDYLSEILDRACEYDGAYIGVHMQTACQGTRSSFAITKWQGDIPVGDDSAEPEEDLRAVAPIADSAFIPQNEPAVLWDARIRDFRKFIVAGAGYGINEDLTIHITAETTNPYIVFNVKPAVSYEAADFPYIAVLTRNCWAERGNIYYCAGDNYTFSQDYCENWDIGYQTYVNGWSLGIIDLSYYNEDGWNGRINALRIGFDFSADDIADSDFNNFDVGFIGAFRSPDEALAYTEAYLYSLGVDIDAVPDVTTEPWDPEPEPEETIYETKYETDYVPEDITIPAWSEIGTYPEDLYPDEIIESIEKLPEIEGELFGDGLLGKLIDVLVKQNLIPGCNSVVAVPILVMVTVFGAALFIKKKD